MTPGGDVEPSRIEPAMVTWHDYGITVRANRDANTTTVEGATGMTWESVCWLITALVQAGRELRIGYYTSQRFGMPPTRREDA